MINIPTAMLPSKFTGGTGIRDDLHPFYLTPLVPLSGIIPPPWRPAKHVHALHAPVLAIIYALAIHPLAVQQLPRIEQPSDVFRPAYGIPPPQHGEPKLCHAFSIH